LECRNYTITSIATRRLPLSDPCFVTPEQLRAVGFPPKATVDASTQSLGGVHAITDASCDYPHPGINGSAEELASISSGSVACLLSGVAGIFFEHDYATLKKTPFVTRKAAFLQ
jgi:hypothetical protein